MMHMLAVGRCTPECTLIEVLPGMELYILPGEDVDAIAESLRNLFAESERCVPMAEPVDDPMFAQWIAEGSQTPHLFADGLTDEILQRNRQRPVDWPEV